MSIYQSQLCRHLLSSPHLKAIFGQFIELPADSPPIWKHEPLSTTETTWLDKVGDFYMTIFSHLLPARIWDFIGAACVAFTFGCGLVIYVAIILGIFVGVYFSLAHLVALIVQKLDSTRRGHQVLYSVRSLPDRVRQMILPRQYGDDVYPGT